MISNIYMWIKGGAGGAVAIRNASKRDVRGDLRSVVDHGVARYARAVRWWVCLGSMLVMPACTAANPAFETSETAEAGPVSDDGETTTAVAPSTGGGTSSATITTEGAGEATETSDTTGAPTEDLPPRRTELCGFGLFAINELGELHALDPTTGTSMLLLTDRRLASWALATDPATGMLYVSELAAPSTVWRVDPFSLAIEAEPIVVEAMDLDSVARATFDGEGHLWLGTEDTNRFLWLPPTGGRLVGDDTLESFPRGGDMVFVETGCAIVPTLDGTLFDVCFPSLGEPPPPVDVLELPLGSKFTGIAIDASGRMWLGAVDPVYSVIPIDRSQVPWTAEVAVEYDMLMNDLAPVVEPPGC